jgi:UDP-N-acetylmuramate-alanine ligase
MITHIIQRKLTHIKRLGNYIPIKVLALFQPHLFSRTKDFADDFAKSLSQFDELLLLDIYLLVNYQWKELRQSGYWVK